MKQFNSKQTTGSEAIVMASVRWWTASDPAALRERMEGKLKSLPSDAFTILDGEVVTKTDQNIGMKYIELDDGLPGECLVAIQEQDGLGYAFQTALEEWPNKDMEKAQDAACVLILRLLAIRIGASLKENTAFVRFAEDITKTRADMKVVRRVMES